MDSNPSPFFPPELEREIFETAAYHDPAMIYGLSLVCRRVHKWLDGMKYATVTSLAIGGCPVHILLQAIQSGPRPPSFFHHHVRNLYLAGGRDWGPNNDDLGQVLSVCSGLRNLVLLLLDLHSLEPLLPALAAIKPRRLVLVREPLLDPHTPLFASLTHLHVVSVPLRGPNYSLRLPSFLAQLPVLTHFAMGVIVFHRANAALAKDILVQCQSLQALIFVTTADVKRFPSIDHDDTRFLLYQQAGHDDFIRGWVAETRGRDRPLGSCGRVYCQEEARGDSATFPLLD
ncbi:hypothetical protein MSAN_00160100 [Mycena sanguinolenta]|uniref:Uncharacterized protein n=1 Tax=Mycena sanguinolenta TaxID=230812 RepID=A0A8H6ZGL0_9AGAR|nr:hypothetical protein MSAN_00160100 [Mycena sanguinolenta]